MCCHGNTRMCSFVLSGYIYRCQKIPNITCVATETHECVLLYCLATYIAAKKYQILHVLPRKHKNVFFCIVWLHISLPNNTKYYMCCHGNTTMCSFVLSGYIYHCQKHKILHVLPRKYNSVFVCIVWLHISLPKNIKYYMFCQGNTTMSFLYCLAIYIAAKNTKYLFFAMEIRVILFRWTTYVSVNNIKSSPIFM
jgi:hypothetical protein